MGRAIPNEITRNDDKTVTITITRRNGDQHQVLVDADVYDAALYGLQWHVHAARHKSKQFYAATYIRGRLWLMHRLLMDGLLTPEKPTVDHINFLDTLINTRKNMRVADHYDQMQNTSRQAKRALGGYDHET
jgi:hypothetical protein